MGKRGMGKGKRKTQKTDCYAKFTRLYSLFLTRSKHADTSCVKTIQTRIDSCEVNVLEKYRLAPILEKFQGD